MGVQRPRVEGLDNSGLRSLCRRLADLVRTFQPDLVVGIANGGTVVAQEIVEALGRRPRLVVVTSQRPGTQVKSRPLVARAIRSMPRRLTNPARWLEVELREARHHLAHRRTTVLETPLVGRVASPHVLTAAMRDVERVLVVDDTVDSGQTLAGVVALAQRANRAAEVRTAVLASTWRRPPLQPDYVLEPRVLLRLPTSIDA